MSSFASFVIRYFAVLLLTFPFAIACQVSAVLIFESERLGYVFLAFAFLCGPTILACCLYSLELRDWRQGFKKGTILGLAVTLSLPLIAGALIANFGIDSGV